MNTLSLFDGISCGRVALERAGIEVNRYFASEVDKHAIKVAQKNYPDTVQIGDVLGVKYRNGYLYTDNGATKAEIDLLIGGSPCQGFSFAGKQLNFKDPRSQLFFEYVRILKEANPKYFLLENVKMKKEYQDVITSYLGVEPVEINSALVSAQNRVRLYWTNIPKITQPGNKNVKLSDILESDAWQKSGEMFGRKLNKATIIGRRLDTKGHRRDYDKTIPITQCLEVRKSNTDKSNCLTTVDKDNVLTPLPYGRHEGAFDKNLPFRYYTVKECCRLQTLPDNYVDSISDSQGKKCLGNGWTVDVITHILSRLKD